MGPGGKAYTGCAGGGGRGRHYYNISITSLACKICSLSSSQQPSSGRGAESAPLPLLSALRTKVRGSLQHAAVTRPFSNPTCLNAKYMRCCAQHRTKCITVIAITFRAFVNLLTNPRRQVMLNVFSLCCANQRSSFWSPVCLARAFQATLGFEGLPCPRLEGLELVY